MRKGFQKRRIALALVGLLAITQMPTTYSNAEEANVVQSTASETVVEGETQAETQQTDTSSELADENQGVVDNSATSSEVVAPESVSGDPVAPETTDGIPTVPQTDNVGADTVLPYTLTIVDHLVTGYTGTPVDVVIPSDVTCIDNNAFEGCASLVSIDLSNVTSIDEAAFYGCTNLSSIDLKNVSSLGDGVFENCTSLTSVDFGNVTSISNYAFQNCTSLTSIDLSGVTSIGSAAFMDCTALASVTNATNVTSIDYDGFFGCYNLADSEGFIVINGILTSGSYEENVTIPNTVKIIGTGAFSSHFKVTNVKIPSSVIAIEEQAFSSCENLTSITIPSNVKTIGRSAFSGCYSMTSVTLEDGVTTLDSGVFSYCYILANITIPDSVTSMGSGIFTNCNGGKVYTTTGGAATNFDNYFTIYCNKNSYAYTYAVNNNILVKTPQDTTEVKVESVKLNNSIIDLTKGETTTLTASVSPDGATNKNVTWSSSDSSVASVDNSGKVTALKAGTATITVSTEDGNKTATCTVNVKDNAILVNSIKLNSTKITLAKKSKIKLVATILPTNASNANVNWTSSDAGVASVSDDGTVTANAAGYAVISATAQDGSNIVSSCNITVSKKKSYKIKYNLNKGKNSEINPSYYATGTKVKLEKPTRKSYIFTGWYIGDEKVTSISKSSTGNITLTAKWEKASAGKTTVSSVKNNKAGQLLVSFDKLTGVDGYTVYYSTNKKLSDATTLDLSSKKKSATITGLSKGTTYYVTVKAYKTDSEGNRVYGKSNKIFKVKISK